MRDPLGHRGSYAPDGAERRPEPRLGGVRALRHVARGERAHGSALRLRGALGVGAGLRGADRLAGAGRADLVRAPVRAPLRGLGGRGLPRPTSSGGRSTVPTPADSGLRPGEGGITFWQGVDLTDRHGSVVAAAGSRLHALLAQPARRVLGDFGRVLRSARAALRARRAAGAVARPGGAERHLHGHRRRRRGQRVRAPRADGGRERRAVRQRVLGRRLAPERRSVGVAAAPRRARRGRSPRSAQASSTSSPTRRSCSCSAPSSCRSSASSRPTSCWARAARWTCAGAGSPPGRPDSRSSSGSTRSARRGGSTRSRASRARETPRSARRCPRSRSPSPCTQAYAPRMRRLGVVGLVSLDRVDGGIPRLGRRAGVRGARPSPARRPGRHGHQGRRRGSPAAERAGRPGGRAAGHADDRVPHRERRRIRATWRSTRWGIRSPRRT